MASVAPLVGVVAFRWSSYVSTTPKAVSLSIGGAVAVILLALKAMGKMPKNTKPVAVALVATALVYALDPLVQDLKYLLTAFTAGELADFAIFQPAINKTKRAIEATYTAEAVATAQEVQTQAIVQALDKVADASGRT